MNHLPQTKSEYFELSLSLALPARCPLLDRCVRRAQTIALANHWPLEDAPSRVGLKKPLLPVLGEGPFWIGGENNFYAGGLCPEVNQFETTVADLYLSGKPTTSGQYDKYRNPQFETIHTGHYSQCAEYVAFEHSLNKTSPSWISTNYQWVIATIITLAGVVAGYIQLFLAKL